jgi:enoyl-CoA hydratase
VTEFETLLLSRDDHGVLEIVLNRPEARNALSELMETEIVAALDLAEADDDVRAVLLRANGPVFSAGHDLKQVASEIGRVDEDGMLDGKPWWVTPTELPRGWTFYKPFVAAVHGYVGPAAQVVIAPCDFIVAAAGTRFSREVGRYGGRAPNGGWQIMHYQMPMRDLKRLWLLSGYYTAERALELRMVQEVVPIEQIEEAGRRWALACAEIPTEGYAATKRGIHRIYELMGLEAVNEGVPKMPRRAPANARLKRANTFLDTMSTKGMKEAVKARDAGRDWDILEI